MFPVAAGKVFVVRSERQPDFMGIDKFSVTDKDRRSLFDLVPLSEELKLGHLPYY